MRFLIGVQKKVNSKAGENSHVMPGREIALVTMNDLPELEIDCGNFCSIHARECTSRLDSFHS